MSENSSSARLQSLVAQSIQWPFLAAPMKAFLVNFTHTTTDTAALTRLENNLELLAEYVAPIDHPQWNGLVESYQDLDSLEALQSALPARQEPNQVGDLFWLAWADELQLNPQRSLFCIANHFSLPILGNANIESLAIRLLGDALGFVSRDQHRATLLESHAGLTNTDYDQPQLLTQKLRQFTANLEPNNATNFVGSLGDALGFVSRDQHRATLLESHAGLTNTDYDQPQLLTQKLRQFTANLTPNNATNFVGSLGDALGFVSRSQHRATLLESHAGLTNTDYDQPQLLTQKLRQFTANLTPNNATNFVGSLGDALGFVSRDQHRATLLESHAGLTNTDYDQPQLLTQKLRQFTANLEPNNATNFVGSLGDALGFVSRDQHRATLLESHAGLTNTDYDQPQLLTQKLRQFTANLTPNNATTFLRSLGDALGFVSRSQHRATLLESHAGLTNTDYDQPQLLTQKLRQFTANLTPNNATNFVGSLGDALGFVSRDQHRATLLESHAGLTNTNYDQPQLLTQKLRQFTANLTPNNATNFVGSLGDALGFVSRDQHRATLLESHAGLTNTDYDQPQLLTQKLRQFTANLTPNNATNFLRSLGDALGFVSRDQHRATLLESHAGLTNTDYDQPQLLTQKLRQFTANLTPNNATNFLRSLGDALGFVSRDQHRATLLETNFGSLPWLDRPSLLVPSNVIDVSMMVIMLKGKKDDSWAKDRIVRIPSFLRRATNLHGMTRQDQRQFVQKLSKLRSSIASVAFHWGRKHPDPHERSWWRQFGLLIDTDLSQKGLLLRFLCGRPTGGFDTAEPPAPFWPFDQIQNGDPFWGLNDNKFESKPNLPNLPYALALFDQHGAPDFPSRPPTPVAVLDTEPPAIVGRANRIVQEGIEAKHLVDLLGNNQLFVRIGLTDNRYIQWSAYSANSGDLKLVAQDLSNCSGADIRLEVLTTLHELRTHLAVVKDNGIELWTTVRANLETIGLDLVNLLSEIAAGAVHVHDADLEGRFDALLSRLGRTAFIAEIPMLMRNLWQGLQRVQSNPDDAKWVAQLWQKTIDAFTNLDHEFPQHADRKTPRSKVLSPLNQATKDLIVDLGHELSLDALAPHLTADTDVVFCVSETLNGLPIAFLPVAGKPLYEQVRSTRCTVSLLLDQLQIEIEKENGPSPNRTFVVSHFAETDPNCYAEKLLHSMIGRRELESQSQYFGAARKPAGAVGAVYRANDVHGKFRVGIVNGHGFNPNKMQREFLRKQSDSLAFEEPSGVRLADGFFHGSEGALDFVELLVVLSCAVGRNHQQSGRDAEGFNVELAMGRVRSALTCLWPVIGLTAVEVTDIIVGNYLAERTKLDETGGDLTQARLRAKALNDARKNLLVNGDDSYLHSMAAFELYGLA